ncbi:hypothetical protein ABZ689_28305, partial [Streptomyces sp. NPDC006874]|uniref:hypothetical protein n=1 Tax=Streptomyces sp. NPDC006874 TaxID=3157189 RepID=UPI0033F40947
MARSCPAGDDGRAVLPAAHDAAAHDAAAHDAGPRPRGGGRGTRLLSRHASGTDLEVDGGGA